ncbi:MAG TPA: hypothetical protein DFS52_06240 [Myxococcales bacterium]|nr:hypothetical protein [Myxococcales bacterium]
MAFLRILGLCSRVRLAREYPFDPSERLDDLASKCLVGLLAARASEAHLIDLPEDVGRLEDDEVGEARFASKPFGIERAVHADQGLAEDDGGGGCFIRLRSEARLGP